MPTKNVPVRHESLAKARIARYLRSRVNVRLHAAVILIVTYIAAIVSGWVLFRAGVTAMPIRYLLMILAGYVVFLVQLKIWLRLWDKSPYHNELTDIVAISEDRTPNSGASASGPYDISGIGDLGNLAAGDGCLFIVAFIVVALVLFCVFGYIIFSAEVLFADMVLEAAIATGVLVVARKMGRPGWEWISVKATLPAVVLLIIVVEAMAAFALARYPQARTMMDVCRMSDVCYRS
jgi:hypothetical protein